MTPDETATVLAKCAAFDQRTVGRADVAAWTEALDDVPVADALAAVTRWYRTSRERVWPSDIRQLAAAVSRERRREQRIEREAAVVAALESAPRTERGRELVDAVRALLPPGDPDKLRWGHRQWRELQRDARRQREAEPNPHYDPAAHAALTKETTDA